jgi:hypothetical protein
LASKKAKPAAPKSASPSKRAPVPPPVAKKPAPAKAAKVAAPAPAKAGKAKPAPASKPAKAPAAPPAKVVAKADKAKLSDVKKGPRPSIPPPSVSAPTRRADGWMGPMPDKQIPRQTKLPQEAEPLTKREMEQVLTVGTRGVAGEGGLKGRLVLYQQMPYLEVIGRDKRELWFLLQGPDQEVFPAYVDHKVSVSGLIKRFHAYGGSVDVRKYSARKPDEVTEVAEVPEVEDGVKLRLLSPGEVESISNPGMSVGVKGVATLRGKLELSGDEYFLVVSNAGTRQQVTFTVEGKATKGLKKFVGEIAVATGVVEKQTAWGGRIEAEVCEPRAPEFPPVSRDALDVVELEVASGTSSPKELEVKVNHGMVIRLAEKQGHVWAIEPQTAKRVSLREVHLSAASSGAVREFFFTPRNPGLHDVEFFLGKLHSPMQPVRHFKAVVNVKPVEVTP